MLVLFVPLKRGSSIRRISRLGKPGGDLDAVNKNFPVGDFTPSSSLLPLITLANKRKLKM